MSNSKAFVKGMGCMGAIITLLAGIALSYLGMRYGWGLEVKNWSAYIWFSVVGTLSSFALSSLFSQMMKD